MEELDGLFIGFKRFQSKDKTKMYNVISLLFLTEDELYQRVTYFVKDVFVDDVPYEKFIKDNKILDFVKVKREIVGDNVRYYI